MKRKIILVTFIVYCLSLWFQFPSNFSLKWTWYRLWDIFTFFSYKKSFACRCQPSSLFFAVVVDDDTFLPVHCTHTFLSLSLPLGHQTRTHHFSLHSVEVATETLFIWYNKKRVKDWTDTSPSRQPSWTSSSLTVLLLWWWWCLQWI